LTGNPYPSAIDLSAFLIEQTNCTWIVSLGTRQNSKFTFIDYSSGAGIFSRNLRHEAMSRNLWKTFYVLYNAPYKWIIVYFCKVATISIWNLQPSPNWETSSIIGINDYYKG
jgi:hypothetical protein